MRGSASAVGRVVSDWEEAEEACAPGVTTMVGAGGASGAGLDAEGPGGRAAGPGDGPGPLRGWGDGRRGRETGSGGGMVSGACRSGAGARLTSQVRKWLPASPIQTLASGSKSRGAVPERSYWSVCELRGQLRKQALRY